MTLKEEFKRYVDTTYQGLPISEGQKKELWLAFIAGLVVLRARIDGISGLSDDGAKEVCRLFKEITEHCDEVFTSTPGSPSDN